MDAVKSMVSWRELCVILAVFCLGALIAIPAVGRIRDGENRASCAANLKQIGIAVTMYSNEARGGVMPALSPWPGNWIMDANSVYPQYTTDLSIFICPASPFANEATFTLRTTYEHPGAQPGDMHPDCVSGLFYTYTSYCLFSDEQAFALFEAFEHGDPEVFLPSDMRDAAVPAWREYRRQAWGPQGIPLVWDRIPPTDAEFSHTPYGANVLHHYGNVEFVRYSAHNASHNFPATRMTGLTFGSTVPVLPMDCY